jgi:hypothetical protein
MIASVTIRERMVYAYRVEKILSIDIALRRSDTN